MRRAFVSQQQEVDMRKTLIAGTFLAVLAMPTFAQAQDAAAGAAAGATTGAVTGAIVGGPIGAAVGAGIGGTVGAAAADAHRPRVIVTEPAVTDGYVVEAEPRYERRVIVAPETRMKQRTCVEHADGTRVCETIRR
jgi:hypothetical protein